MARAEVQAVGTTARLYPPPPRARSLPFAYLLVRSTIRRTAATYPRRVTLRLVRGSE